MKRCLSLATSIALLLATAISPPALAGDADQARILDLYDGQFTKEIAKSLDFPATTLSGDRFATIRFKDGAWAVAYVPRNLDVHKGDSVELPATGTISARIPGTLAIAKMLTKRDAHIDRTSVPLVTGSAN